ncbi:MAG TPA: hemerythrin domain-containing protein [Anaeromyxobacter sp.]|nr:hemerythrin domain-containing protein [Anaeromyxobacter sp.]
MVEAHAWNEELDVAHEAMDHDHHLQIALVSAFADAVEQRRPWLARRLAEQLVRYSAAHFASEELLMQAAGYPEREAHAAEHGAFLVQMRDLEATFDEEAAEAALAAALDLRSALAGHIKGADRRLVNAVGR